MMKTYRIILSLILVAGISLMVSCDGGTEPTPESEFLSEISTNWTLQKATLNGKDMTRYFPGLVLSLSRDKSYTVTNAVSPIWPSNGTFELVATSDPGRFNVQRNDGVLVTVTELDEMTMKFAFAYDAPGGRTRDISGGYEFEMVR